MPATPAERNVLLVEEYDALAVAIDSALQKFAPHHRVHVIRSLAEARLPVLQHQPELIIVDFDPPHSSAISVFQELKALLPDTRVLLVASGTSGEVTAQRSRGALQLLEKPFDLAEFGAAVQALLGPWRETNTSRGTLRDFGLVDAIVLGCLAGSNGGIQVKADDHSGAIHFQNGHIVHATAGTLDGKTALHRMLSWKAPQLWETKTRFDGRRTVDEPWPTVLQEALRERQKEQRVADLFATQPVAEAAEPAKRGPKILVIDDTEMLLIFVEDSLRLANANLQITTALTGLHGVKEALRIIPDLILVDYSLPDIKGDEVCRRIGANAATARIPVIMMSGHVHEMTAAAVRLPNVVATIAKPFLSEALVTLVRQTLRQGPLRKTTAQLGADQPMTPDKTSALPPSPPRSAPPKLQLATPASPTAAPPKTTTAPPMSAAPNEVLLDLPLDVIAMQVNTFFQIGSIRARPASPTVAIQIPALAARAALPLETAFQLGPIDLDNAGRISVVRLIPTSKRFQPVETRTAFAIGGVAVVPANDRERLQLMSAANSTMTMQLFAPLQLVSVELSTNLEVKQLVLRCRANAVRVALNSIDSHAHSGANFQTTAVQLDEGRRIKELTLAPVT